MNLKQFDVLFDKILSLIKYKFLYQERQYSRITFCIKITQVFILSCLITSLHISFENTHALVCNQHLSVEKRQEKLKTQCGEGGARKRVKVLRNSAVKEFSGN